MRITLLFYSSLFLVTLAHADTVRLEILGPDQKPVVGAQVRIIESSGFILERKTEAPLDLSSDAMGKISFESKHSLTQTPSTPNRPILATTSINSLAARITAPGLAVWALSLKAGDNAIILQPGQNWGGVALDEARKPIPGVKITLSGLSSESGSREAYLPKGAQLETVTDAEGKWSFTGVPRQGSARLTVNDPRFVRETLTLSLNAATAPPIFLERGATIKGRLLAPDGKGAANAPLHPGGSESFALDEDFRTGPDGRFEFSSLRAGDYYLQILDMRRRLTLPFIVEPRTVSGLKVGEIRDLGDWKTTAGLAVKGNVVDSETRAPLADASIRLWGRGNAQGTSDKTGAFTFRASEDASQSTVAAPGYVPWQGAVPVAAKGVLDLGTVELKRGMKVTGTLKNQDGKNVANRQLYAEENRSRERQYAFTSNGAFSFDALAPGNYTLKLQEGKLVSGAAFSVVKGQKTAPLTAVMEAKSLTPTPKKLVGRALDEGGNPVAGAKIVLRISNTARSYQTVRAVSGMDGNFEANFSLDNGTPKVQSVAYPDLLFLRSEVKVVGSVWSANLFFQAHGAALKGRVVNAAGQPVAHAFVSVMGRNDLPIVQSDEKGAFSLPDVPLEGVTLVAAASSGRAYSETPVVKAGDTLEVKLGSTTEYDEARLADEILPTAYVDDDWGEGWNRTWETLGAQRMEAALVRRKAGDRYWSQSWDAYLRLLARRAPQDFLARGEELVGQVPTDNFEAVALLAGLRARSFEAADRAKARVWLKAESQQKRELNAATVGVLLRLGLVAEALKAGDGAHWEEYAAQVAAQLSDQARANNAEQWGQSAASIGVPAFEDFIQDWKMNAQLNAMHGGLLALVQAGDVAAARQMLGRMEATVAAAAAAPDQIKVEGFVQKPKDILGQARGELASKLSETEPAAALKLIPEASEYLKSELLLKIARRAVKLGLNEVATQALREVFESTYANVEPGAEAAGVALSFDAKLADELFQKAWEKSKPRGVDDDFGYRPSIAAYAAARASKWGGESRILIERDWAERIKSYKLPQDNDFDSSLEALEALVKAMAKVDARRALEMVAQLPEKDTVQAQARGEIAVALLEK